MRSSKTHLQARTLVQMVFGPSVVLSSSTKVLTYLLMKFLHLFFKRPIWLQVASSLVLISSYKGNAAIFKYTSRYKRHNFTCKARHHTHRRRVHGDPFFHLFYDPVASPTKTRQLLFHHTVSLINTSNQQISEIGLACMLYAKRTKLTGISWRSSEDSTSRISQWTAQTVQNYEWMN